MHAVTKKLGELLVDAGLISMAQLQAALRQQRISGGRMGSNLVALGIITEDLLMDFLAQQTGVPRLDVHNLEIPPAVLERIPRRLAEQLVILPVAFKEPKSLLMAMADPSDLNALDSARFAAGMTIEPMVASHSALKQAIAEQYRRMETGSLGPAAAAPKGPAIGLDMPFELPLLDFSDHGLIIHPQGPVKDFPKDPFFGTARPPTPAATPNPFSFFTAPTPEVPPPAQTSAGTSTDSGIIHARSAGGQQVPPIESFGTRALVLGLIRMLQRRGVLGEDELQRLLANLIEAGEIDPKL